MKKNKLIAMILAVLLLAFVAVGCAAATPATPAPAAPGAAAPAAAPAADDQPTFLIAFSVKDQNNPIFVDMADGVRDFIDWYNAEVAGYEKFILNMQAATGETMVEEQITMHETFIAMNAAAIISTPLASDPFVDFVLRCNELGIPFINIDTRVNSRLLAEAGGMYDIFIGTDREWMGRALINTLIEDWPDGVNYILLGGNPGTSTHIDMYRGIRGITAELGPEFNELAFEYCMWQEALALEAMTNFLPAHPTLQAVVTFNDQMAQGTIAAIESFGLVPGEDIIVYGSNFVGNAPRFIYEGVQRSSISAAPWWTGWYASQAAINAILGVSPLLPNMCLETNSYLFESRVFRQGDFQLIDGRPHDFDGNLLR